MSRLKSLLNHRIPAGEFLWDPRYEEAELHAMETYSVYTTSQQKIALRLPLMRQIQWIHNHVQTKQIS